MRINWKIKNYFYHLKREFWDHGGEWRYAFRAGKWSKFKQLFDYKFWVYDILTRCRKCGVSYYAFMCSHCHQFGCRCACGCSDEDKKKREALRKQYGLK